MTKPIGKNEAVRVFDAMPFPLSQDDFGNYLGFSQSKKYSAFLS